MDGILTLTYSCADQLYCGVGYDVQVPAGLSQVTASTSAGSINGSGLAVNRAEFSTQAGSISVAFTSAPAMVGATVSAGAITIRVPATVSYAVTAQANVSGAKIWPGLVTCGDV